MPEFIVTAPDGTRHKVNAPEGADDKSILGFLTSVLAPRQADPALLGGLTEAQANAMSQQDLNMLRIQHAKDMEYQKAISPYEHKATAREAVEENPLMAIPYAAMVPGYAVAKALHLLPEEESTTPPSWAQVIGGYQGIGQGLEKAYESKIAKPISQLIKESQSVTPSPLGSIQTLPAGSQG